MDELKNIKVSEQEKSEIKKDSPDTLPLNPTAQGFSGAEIRRRLSKSITGEKGSVLSLFVDKMVIISDLFHMILDENDDESLIEKIKQIDGDIENILLELVNKVDKENIGNRIYGTTPEAQQTSYALAENPNPSSIPFRDSRGAIKGATASANQDLVPLEQLNAFLNDKVNKIKTGTGDSAINQVYGTDHLGNDKVFKASEINIPRSVVLRDYEGVIEDLSYHNVNQNAHQDIRNMISALQGGIIPRGLLEYTTDNIRYDKTLLDTYIQNNYSREAQLGDMVRDSDNIEWYYNGEFWDELGPYSLIPLASMYNDGLMSNIDYQMLSQLEADTAFYSNTHGIPVKIKFQKVQLAAGQTMDDALSTLPVIDYEAEGGYIPIIRYTFYDSDGNIVGESMGNKPITTGSGGGADLSTQIITLPFANWTLITDTEDLFYGYYTQTTAVLGVDLESVIWLDSVNENYNEYIDAEIKGREQGLDEITFIAIRNPGIDVNVKVVLA